MSHRELDKAFEEDITEQQLQMEHDMEMDLRFEEPDHDQYIEEYDPQEDHWMFEDPHFDIEDQYPIHWDDESPLW